MGELYQAFLVNNRWGGNSIFVSKYMSIKNGFLLKNKTSRKQKKTKRSDPWTWSEERLDRGHGSELLLFWVILVLPWFLQFGQNHEKTKKQKN